MMLRMTNIAGTHIYPRWKAGQSAAMEQSTDHFHVFVPDGPLQGGDWACTIENENSAVVIETQKDLALLITALEIAYERVKARDK